jgi:hypothetical protein
MKGKIFKLFRGPEKLHKAWGSITSQKLHVNYTNFDRNYPKSSGTSSFPKKNLSRAMVQTDPKQRF